MPFFAPGNPSSPLPQSLSPQFPPYELMMRLWGNAQQRAPWAVQPGFQPIPHQFPQVPGGGMLAQPVADIYPFIKKGLLGNPGPEMGGRRGMLGGGRYNFRDPASVAQFEKDRGLPAGSIKAPSAEVTRIPTDPQARLLNRMENDPNWRKADPMPGPRADGYVHATDVLKWAKENNIPRDQALQMANDLVPVNPVTGKVGPTPAQMARPVKQTPEISAKLAAARADRAERIQKFVDSGPPPGFPVRKVPSAKDTAQTSFGGTMSRPEFSLRDYAKAIERGPEAAKAYRKLHLPQSGSKSTEVWGPSTPGWNRLSKEAKDFLRGKPVKGPQ